MPSLWQWPVARPDDLDRWTVYHHFARVLDLDHQANHKPWSWALIEDGPGSWALRLGLLDDARLPRLLRAATPPLAARFDDTGADRGPVQVAAVEWPALRAGARASSWTMTFASPATFRNGNRR
jgi:hypothetical protein